MAAEPKSLDSVPFTMLMTLAARAAAHDIAPEVEFYDSWAARLLERLPYELASCRNDACFVTYVALRAKLMDWIAARFLKNNPDAAGVGLGCGLCARSRRISSGGPNSIEFPWYFVDLPEVIEIRKQYSPPLPGERLIASKITDLSWLDAIKQDRPLIFIMEGVASYLPQESNNALFKALGDRFGDSGTHAELIFDYIHPALADGAYITNKAGGIRTPFQSGFPDASAVKKLHPSIRVISEHNFFSQISTQHKIFEMEFEAATLGQKPYNIIHIKFGGNG